MIVEIPNAIRQLISHRNWSSASSVERRTKRKKRKSGVGQDVWQQSSSPSRRKPKEKPRDRQRSNVNIVCGDEESDSDDYCLMVESVNSVYQKESSKKIFANMVFDETSVKF